MDRKDIFKTVDHTLLTQTATWDEIRQILDDAKAQGILVVGLRGVGPVHLIGIPAKDASLGILNNEDRFVAVV